MCRAIVLLGKIMSLFQKLYLSILLLASVSAYAVSSYSGDSLNKIYLEMRYLYQIGIDIHQRYDLTDPLQINACELEVGHNSTRAKGLIGAANRIEYPDKEALIDTAWAVYACSSCIADGSSCDMVPSQMKQLRSYIKDQQASKNI